MKRDILPIKKCTGIRIYEIYNNIKQHKCQKILCKNQVLLHSRKKAYYTPSIKVLTFSHVQYFLSNLLILQREIKYLSYLMYNLCFIPERKKACCILHSQHESIHIFNNFLSNLLIWQREIKYLLQSSFSCSIVSELYHL